MRVITVDPGFKGTGWALWDHWELRETGVKRIDSKRSLSDRARQLFWEIKQVYDINRADLIYVEWPKYFASAKGQAAAGGDSLRQLFLAASMCVAAAFSLGIGVELLDVNDWKGQLTKHQVAWRVESALHRKFRDHELDAVGMGLHLRGER